MTAERASNIRCECIRCGNPRARLWFVETGKRHVTNLAVCRCGAVHSFGGHK